MNKFIISILVVAGIVLLLKSIFPGVGSSPNEWVHIVYILILLTFIGGSAFSHYSGKKIKALKDIAIWLCILLVLVVGYSFRYEFKGVKDRLVSELMPFQHTQHASGEISFRMAKDGHFYIETMVSIRNMRGVSVRFMLDTGASKVTLSPSDAKRLGYNLEELAYNQMVQTANGTTFGAPVKLQIIKIGDFVVEDTPSTVNNADMSHSLLGMSYLERLGGYSVSGDVLTFSP